MTVALHPRPKPINRPTPMSSHRSLITDHSALLDTYLRASFAKRYQPGEHDCVLFIAAWADLISGSNHVDFIRDTYRTHFEGLRRHVGKGSTISTAVQARLLAAGWELVTDAGNYQTGDIILTDGDHPGIWRGKSIVATAFGFAGHAYLHRRHATAALRWPHGSPHSPSAVHNPVPLAVP
ncbi:hypothetical protein EON82_25165 [bacterium]|nr:MAG: hypothetical protein EON82_25165 [bacterium]